MSNSPLAAYTKISPNKTSPRTHVIDTISIHCTSGQNSVETLGNIFAKTSRKASSNYGIGYDGKIGMYVEEKDRSWCTSSASNDNRAITIEVASDSTHPYKVKDAAYKSLIALLVDICKRNNIKELKWKADKTLIGQVSKQNMTVHRWFANKACPGDYLYNLHYQIASEVNKQLSINNASSTVVAKNESAYTLKEFIKDVQKSCGASIDGIAGQETLSKTITVSAKKNNKHKVVKYIQKRLLAIGYSEVGVADGIAGKKFTSAVIRFQKDNGCVADGEVTAKNKTWKKLLCME